MDIGGHITIPPFAESWLYSKNPNAFKFTKKHLKHWRNNKFLWINEILISMLSEKMPHFTVHLPWIINNFPSDALSKIKQHEDRPEMSCMQIFYRPDLENYDNLFPLNEICWREMLWEWDKDLFKRKIAVFLSVLSKNASLAEKQTINKIAIETTKIYA